MRSRDYTWSNVDRFRRGVTLSWLVLFVLSILLQYGSLTNPQSTLAVHDEGLFELDGNAVNDAAAGDDWDQVYNDTSNADSTQFIIDPVDSSSDETFTGGSTKDGELIGDWLWKHFKASQAKNDITNAFAAAYTNPADDHSIIYFGLNKYEADGDNFVGFWFVQDQVGLTGSGNSPGSPFVGEHVVGDILVLADYTNGGSLATFSIYRWVGSGGDANASGTLDTVASGVPCTGGGGDDACGATNGANETSPWPFVGRDADLPDEANVFLPGTFFEGGIDLTALGIDTGCFSTFIAETRSSQSVSATLSDFALGSFSFCHEPDLSTQVSASQISIGDAGVVDTAHLSFNGDPVTTGSVDFFLCGPTVSAADCSSGGTAAGTDSVDSSGNATSNLVSPTEPGFYCFRAEYTPAEGSKFLATSHTNSTTECFEVVVGVVDVVKVANPAGPVSAGDAIGFDITVSNTGGGNLYDVVLADDLPAGADLDWAMSAPTGDTTGVSCSITGAVGAEVLGCTDDVMAPGDSFTVHVSSDTTADDCGLVENTADVFSGNDGEDSADASVQILCAQINVLKVANPAGPVNAGDTIGFDVTVTNGGAGTAHGVDLTDNLPAGGNLDWTLTGPTGDTTGVSCSITGAVGAEVLSCTDDSMAAGDSFTVHVSSATTADDCGTVENTASVTTSNDGSDESTDSVVVNCPNVWVTKVAADDPINAGDTASFTIDFGNDGVGDAYDVHVEDQLPSGSWTLGGADAADCAIDGSNVLSCDFDVLAAGESRSITVSRETVAADCGLIANDITIAASNEPAGADGDNADGDTITVNCPNVWVTKVAADDPINAGDTASFTIDFGNDGVGDAYDVHVEDQLPSGSWTLGGADAADCAIDGSNVLSCDFDILAAGESRSITVSRETVAADCGLIANDITIAASNEPAGADGDNADGDTITVNCPDIVITKTADDATVNAGDPIGFWIEVTNTGDGTAYDVAVTDALPGGADLDWTAGAPQGDTTGVSCAITGAPGAEELSCSDDAMASGESFMVHITSNTTAEDCGVVNNQAFVTTSNDGSDDDSSSITILCAEIGLTKTSDDSDVVVELEKVGFTVTVSNDGAGDAYNVHVSDPLPAGFDWVLDQASDAGWSIVGGSLVFDASVLEADDSSSAHVTSVTDREDCGPVHNVASATSSNDGSAEAAADATVRCPELPIDKSYVGNTGGAAPNGTGIAKVGDILTYTLAYDLTDGPVTNGVITDTLPAGLAYVPASATNNDEFTFVNYDAGTRTLTWTAPTVTKDGSVSYEVVVLDGSFNLPQPLVNTATIDSNETPKDDDTENVLVQTVLAETATPVITLPPTDTIDSGDQAPSNPGFGLMLALLVIAGIGLVMGYLTPTPGRTQREEVRRR